MTPSVTRVAWRPGWRIVPSRFVPTRPFERVSDRDDLDAVLAVEALTSAPRRSEAGEVQLVAHEDRASGPDAAAIMAPFTHRNPAGSRFSDGTFGVCYVARELDTAVAETTHHRERFMRATAQPRMEIDMRVHLLDLAARLYDLRGRRDDFPLVYHDDRYTAGQRLAAKLYANGSDGIVYDSVRRQKGQCAAVFRPRLLSNWRLERHLCYVWDGQRIDTVYEKRAIGRDAGRPR